MAEDMSGSI